METIITGINYLAAHPEYVAWGLATLGAWLAKSPLKPKAKK